MLTALNVLLTAAASASGRVCPLAPRAHIIASKGLLRALAFLCPLALLPAVPLLLLPALTALLLPAALLPPAWRLLC
jgi:hypothetical protein